MAETMLAARLHAPGDLRIERVERPEPGPNDALVRVAACGVCGSDVPRVMTTGTYHFPTIPGHEFAGSVAELGSGVEGFAAGDRVAVIPLIPCRACPMCERGYFAQCLSYDFLGSRSDGGFAEYVRVPAANLVRVPDSVGDEAAAMLEPTATTLNAVRNTGVTWGQTVVVFGLGAIGNLAAQWAKAFGAVRVFAVDLVPHKVEIARRCGLADATTMTGDDLAEAVRAATGGAGADVVLEASGSAAAFASGVSLLRPFGRLGLLGRPGRTIDFPDAAFERILRYQITVCGNWSFGFTAFPAHPWRESLAAMERGQIVIEPMVTHRFPLSGTLEAVRLMAERREEFCKIVVAP